MITLAAVETLGTSTGFISLRRGDAIFCLLGAGFGPPQQARLASQGLGDFSRACREQRKQPRLTRPSSEVLIGRLHRLQRFADLELLKGHSESINSRSIPSEVRR
jgi:hypothetical protein